MWHDAAANGKIDLRRRELQSLQTKTAAKAAFLVGCGFMPPLGKKIADLNAKTP